MSPKTLELPLGLSASDIIRGGTPRLAALIPHTRTVLKFCHGDPDKHDRCEARMYELLSKSNIFRRLPSLLYEGRSKCGRGIPLQLAVKARPRGC
ncbi:hypothetical protein V2W45_1360547 [Cenococcum geophilum]